MKEKVAIQGIAGSFHHQVAREYFGNDVEVEECMSFQEVVANLLAGRSGKAVMAIENSIVGSILPNYALIDDNNLRITGEHYIPIQMNMMAVPGQKIEDIKKVYSHPMALLQCKEFFKNYPHIKLVEDEDTASVAKRISENGKKHVAALASRAAANLFDLEILAENVHTLKSNSTRFLVLQKNNEDLKENISDKASMKFILESRRGSLAEVLEIISDHKLDMSKIQSVPVGNTPWKYAFFVDVLFDMPGDFEEALALLMKKTDRLTVLGTYKNKWL